MHDARANPLHIPVQPHHAVGLMSPQVSPYEVVGNQMGGGIKNTDGGKYSRGKGGQTIGFPIIKKENVS